MLAVLSHCALGRKKGGKGAIFHAFCVVCARARSTVGGKEDLVEAVEAAADFLVLAPGASRVTVLKVKQVIGLKMLLMKTCTFVFLAPGQGWLGRVVGYSLAWAARRHGQRCTLLAAALWRLLYCFIGKGGTICSAVAGSS